MQDTVHTVFLSSDIFKSCEHCSHFTDTNSDIADQINHYLEHGYKLLHIGQQTSHDMDGKPWQSTVAVLGRN